MKGDRDRRGDALRAAERAWGAAALMTGDDRALMIRVGTRYAMRAVCEGLAADARGGPEASTAVRTAVVAAPARN